MNLDVAETLARELMEKHGLTRWKFEWNDSRNYLGQCDKRKRTILLSRLFITINSRKQVKETILHEIAHALTKSGKYHDAEWKAVSRQLGCSPISRCDVTVAVPYRYRTVCKKHGPRGFSNRRVQVSCSVCSSEFDSRYLLDFIEVKEGSRC